MIHFTQSYIPPNNISPNELHQWYIHFTRLHFTNDTFYPIILFTQNTFHPITLQPTTFYPTTFHQWYFSSYHPNYFFHAKTLYILSYISPRYYNSSNATPRINCCKSFGEILGEKYHWVKIVSLVKPNWVECHLARTTLGKMSLCVNCIGWNVD